MSGVTLVAARAQLLGQYYPVGIPNQRSWFSDAVLDRPRPAYDPLGVRAGNFVIRPELTESLGYNSNIFGATNAVGSSLARTQGSVTANSNWTRDALDATVSFERLQYLQHPEASHTDWAAGLGGAIDVGRDRIKLAYTHLTATTAAAEVGTFGNGQPITISFDTARASYQATLGRITLEPAIDVALYRFSNGPAGGSGEAAGDRNSFTGSLTAGYELAPGSTLVLVTSGTSARYITKVPGALTPDYNDIAVLAGIDYRSGVLFRYRATLGYEQRSYDTRGLQGSSAPLAEFDVVWTPTRLTTVTGQVSRSLQDSVGAAAAENYTYTNARLELDHEYLRNVLLQGYGELETAEYHAAGNTQYVVLVGGSVTWLLNRKLSLVGRVSHARSTDKQNSALNQTSSLAELALEFHL